ncbi:MAG: PqiC family protein [Polyangiaceae bacterium]
MNFTSLRFGPALLATLALSMAACAGSPDPAFYALSSQNGRQLQGPALRIEMRRAGLPGYLDRPHIVRRASAERLALAADERWGAPLDAMVSATLGDDLAERLPNCVLFSEAGSISTAADVRVEVEVTHFELDADGAVHLKADAAVRWSAGKDAVRVKRHAITVQPSGKSTEELIASMSRALAQLADAIAQTIVEGPPPPSEEPAAPTG